MKVAFLTASGSAVLSAIAKMLHDLIQTWSYDSVLKCVCRYISNYIEKITVLTNDYQRSKYIDLMEAFKNLYTSDKRFLKRMKMTLDHH